VGNLPGGLLAGCDTREDLAGWMRCPLHVPDMTTDDSVSELLAKSKRAREMATAAYPPERKLMLASIAADYEQLARCQLVFLETQRHLVESRRLLGEFSHMIRA
jgi:hypothetical protein